MQISQDVIKEKQQLNQLKHARHVNTEKIIKQNVQIVQAFHHMKLILVQWKEWGAMTG